MMIAFRGLLMLALVSSLGMQSMYKPINIDNVLNLAADRVCGVMWVEQYLAAGGSVNARGTLRVLGQEMRRMNLLMASALFDNAKLMRFLLAQKNVKLNRQSELGNTALMIAAVNGYTGLVSILLDAGADPLARNQLYHNSTALWQAENSPIRKHYLHNCDNKYYSFPRMIAFLKEAERNSAPRRHQKEQSLKEAQRNAALCKHQNDQSLKKVEKVAAPYKQKTKKHSQLWLPKS